MYYLDDASLVHGDAVLGVFGQLEQRPGSGPVNILVARL